MYISKIADKRSCFLVAILSLTFWLFAPASVVAQVESTGENEDIDMLDERPNVEVDLYFIHETVLCGPYGLRNCRQIPISRIEELHQNGDARMVEDSVPPEEISLGTLFNSIHRFADGCAVDEQCARVYPEDRYLIVLVIEVLGDDLVGAEIQLERKPTEDGMPSYSSSLGYLSERGRWLNYQRADAFYPGYDVEHVLRVNTWQWQLGFIQ